MDTIYPEQNRIEALFGQSLITVEDYSRLSPDEKAQFEETKRRLMGELKGKELTALYEKLQPLLPDGLNNEVWECNHTLISNAIHRFMEASNRMPSKSEIAAETGLSRVTVRKHLQEYSKHEITWERKERFRLMEHKLISTLYQKCITGDVSAMKLYFEITGLSNKNKEAAVINNQHNYIQVNNFKLSQEEVQKLTQEQLLQIEAIVRNTPLIKLK